MVPVKGKTKNGKILTGRIAEIFISKGIAVDVTDGEDKPEPKKRGRKVKPELE